MRFLLDADLARSAADVIRGHGHEVIDVRDIGMRSAKDVTIAEYAKANGLCLVTADGGFADITNYPPHEYVGLVVLEPPKNATARFINQMLDRFLQQTHVLERVPGRLAIVEPHRIRLRPPVQP